MAKAYPFTLAQISTVIRLAWEDRIAFQEIQKCKRLVDREIITIRRRELKPLSFRR